MSGALLTISCPRCNFSQQVPAENIVDGPLSQTCPSCALLFRVGRSLGEVFPSDPTFETDDGWYVRKDGSEVLYFPNLEILRRWSLEGHVNSSDEVSKKGKSWRPIYELPEFASMMVWQDNATTTTEQEPRTPTSELEQVSEEMIEVEEFSIHSGRSQGIWTAIGVAFFLGLGSAIALIFVGGDKPAEVTAQENNTATNKVAVEPADTGTNPLDSSDATASTAVAAPEVEDTASAESDVPAVAEKATPEVTDTRPQSATPEPPRKKTRSSEGRKRKASRKESPQDYDALMDLGARQLRSKDTASQAVQTFMMALQSPEATSEARAKLGRAFLLVGDMESAVKHLERARKRNPGYRPALWDLARAYQTLGKQENAISIFRALSDLLDPDSRQGQQVAKELERMGAKP